VAPTQHGEDARPWTQPRRTLLATSTYEAIKEALIRNQLPPGEWINLELLARNLAVSATPVRQALTRLSAEGLVTAEPYRGFVASKLLDRDTIAEIYESRTLIEPFLAARAATRIDERGLASLTRLVELDPSSMVAADGSPDLSESALSPDEQIHHRIAEIAGNQTLVAVLDGLAQRMAAYRSFVTHNSAPGEAWVPTESHLTATQLELREVLLALGDADGSAAHEAMAAHLQNASERNSAMVLKAADLRD
jgi:DNA-binding GntR family transcriptional regulator